MNAFLKRIAILAITLTALVATAQDGKNAFNPVQTGVTSLNIAPDARSASMGDLGAATDPDANSQYWNPSKYAFAYSNAAVSLSYTPWLRKLVNDIFLANLTGYIKLGSYDNQALSASLRYFSLGEVNTTDGAGYSTQSLNPYEMAVDFVLKPMTIVFGTGSLATRIVGMYFISPRAALPLILKLIWNKREYKPLCLNAERFI
jgi:hypothetical protein